MLIPTVIFLLFGEFMIDLFVERGAPDVSAVLLYGVGFLSIAAIMQLFDGIQVIATNILRGFADTLIPSTIVCTAYTFFGIAGALWLAFAVEIGPLGIWIGLTTGTAVAAFSLTLRVKFMTQPRRLLQGETVPEPAHNSSPQLAKR